jgi:lambda repressor-like predicted transcriptional regulator
MSPHDIKAKIALAGTSQAAIAKHLGVRPASVAKVIKGEMRSKRIEAELKKITGQTVNPRPCRPLGRPKTVWTGKVMQVTA